MNQILNHILTVWMPVYVRSLFRDEHLKGFLERILKRWRYDGVGFDYDSADRVKCVDETGLVEKSRLASQLFNALWKSMSVTGLID
jgi:hypothetical protein